MAVMQIAAQFANSGLCCWGCPHERRPPPLISDKHPLLCDPTSGFKPPPNLTLAHIQIQDINNNPKLIILSTIVDRLHKQCEPDAPLRDIILKVYKHLDQHPHASIARMIPSNVLDDFKTWFDLKQQALASPLTPSSKLDEDCTPAPSIYAPEISFLKEEVQCFAKHYKGTIDDPSGNQTSKSSWANTPWLRNTWMIINNPGEPSLSNIIRKCLISAENNITVMLIIGDSLADSPLHDCPKFLNKTSKTNGKLFSHFLSLAPCVLPHGTVHGWQNHSSSYTQLSGSTKIQPINALPQNAPRGHDHTATFKTNFLLFAPPAKLKTLMSPSSARLDSLAWNLGWTCNSPPLKQPSTWHLTPENNSSYDLSFALLTPRTDRDPLEHLPVWRPWQSTLRSNTPRLKPYMT